MLYFTISLITLRMMYHELSKSTGKMSSSQRDITYRHKNAIIQVQISCRRSNFVKNYPGVQRST